MAINDKHEENSQKCVYIYSEEYLRVCDSLPKIKSRARLVHKLLESYKLLDEIRLVPPRPASQEELSSFHCKKFIHCLEDIQKFSKRNQESDCCQDVDVEGLMSLVPEMDDHGIGYDCAPFERILDYVSFVAGGTIQCAELLNAKKTRIAVNLNGGWHHAHRDEAAGFCYVNDIVLGILKLREHHKKILYVDLDIHHGDGVEEAFARTDKVMTVSLHKYQDGYFPGTGSISEVGRGLGKYYTVNVPLKEATDDEQYCYVFTSIMDSIKDAFQPDVIVCQCGADGVSGDPLGGFNLTGKAISKCVEYLDKWKLPMLVLGGGGYNFTNTSRTWANVMASLLNKELDSNIPEHEYFEEYSPLFDINITPSLRKSCNMTEYLDEVISIVKENLVKVKEKSTQKQSVGANISYNGDNKISRQKYRKRLLENSPTKENKPITSEPCGPAKRVCEFQENISENDVMKKDGDKLGSTLLKTNQVSVDNKLDIVLKRKRLEKTMILKTTTSNNFDFDDF